MAPVKLYIATTIDGYIARRDGNLDWLHELPNPGKESGDVSVRAGGVGMKKVLKLTLLLVLVALLLRAPIFRLLVKYESVGARPGIALRDESLKRHIDSLSAGRELRMEDIARLSNKIVTYAERICYIWFCPIKIHLR